MRAIVLAAFAAFVAGCGSSSDVNLDNAADATSADTSRFEMQYEITGIPGNRSFKMTARGLFDFPNQRGIMSIDGDFAALAGFSEGVAFKEFRLIENTGYAGWSVKGKDYWVKEAIDDKYVDAAELLVPLPGTPTKPTDVLARVLRASPENHRLGTEEVRGTKTTHFRARVDLRELVDQLPAGKRPDQGAVDAWGSRFVPVEIWIDGESRLRRITLHQTGDEVTTSMRVDMFDYGTEADVEPPTGDFISEDELDKLAGGSGESTNTLEAGEAEEMPPADQPGNKESE